MSILAVSACAPASSGPSDETGDVSCEEGQTRCAGSEYQTCAGGKFETEDSCAAVCVPDFGCAECNPLFGTSCSGDDVVSCNADGTIGGVLETCAAGQCSNGQCATDCAADGADLVYVVDDTYNLLSFDPRKLGTPEDPFTLIGSIDCPAGAPWPEWGGGSTPFSMSIDRDANAWVLYTSGEIFQVSTQDASCQPTAFQRGQSNFKLFGMGFVSDAAGSSQETLWIAGGPVDVSGVGDLARVDKASLLVSRVGPLPPGAELSPELTGTGAGELFGYYPGVSSSKVAQLDKATGQHGETWNLAGLGNSVRAWAFAHWGGQFYIFVTTQGLFGDLDTRVKRFDPGSGGVSDVVTDVPYVIVGAGVSTCAPIIIE